MLDRGLALELAEDDAREIKDGQKFTLRRDRSSEALEETPCQLLASFSAAHKLASASKVRVAASSLPQFRCR
jgi:hypothetical protein